MTLIRLWKIFLNEIDDLEVCELIKKTIYGIVTALLFITFLYFDSDFPQWLNISIAVACIVGAHELFSVFGFVNCSENKNVLVPMMLTFIFQALSPFLKFNLTWLLVWYVYTFFYMVIALALRKFCNFKDLVVVYVLNVVVSLFLRMLVELRDLGGVYGGYFVMWVLLIACVTDTGAYFGGSYIGKTKLCEDVSPKKTIEGSICGLITSVAVSLIVFVFIKIWILGSKMEINYLLVALITAVGSIISMLGDLFFSYVKRICKVKDFGNLIPGHGGVLDRVDSVVFVSPFVFMAVYFLVAVRFVG